MATYSASSNPATASIGSGLRSAQVTLMAMVMAAIAVPVVLVLAVVFGLLPGIAWWVAVPVGVLVAVAAVFWLVRGGTEACLHELGAVPADPENYTRYHNLVYGLSLSGGIAKPDLYVVDDEARNAACVAGRDRSAIVATTGLLAALDRIALEGLMSVAVVRVRSGEAAAATLGATLFGRLLPAVGALGLKSLLNADRDLAADRAAVSLTRYPPGLLAALTTIREGAIDPVTSAPRNGHLWLVPPSAVAPRSSSMVRAAPLDLRIDVLAEL